MSTLSETVSILVSMDAKRLSTLFLNVFSLEDSSEIAFNKSCNSETDVEVGFGGMVMSSDETCKWGFVLRKRYVWGGEVFIIVGVSVKTEVVRSIEAS